MESPHDFLEQPDNDTSRAAYNRARLVVRDLKLEAIRLRHGIQNHQGDMDPRVDEVNTEIATAVVEAASRLAAWSAIDGRSAAALQQLEYAHQRRKYRTRLQGLLESLRAKLAESQTNDLVASYRMSLRIEGACHD